MNEETRSKKDKGEFQIPLLLVYTAADNNRQKADGGPECKVCSRNEGAKS